MGEGFLEHGEPAALVFDCDGTLVDTMPAHFLAWRATMSKHGIDFTEARFYELGGVPTQRIVAMLAREAGLMLDAAAIAHEKEEAYYALSDRIAAIEPVVAIARDHRGRLPMAVATGSVRASAERSLKKIGVFDWFEAIVAAEDVAHPKPAPDVFLEAARRLGVTPARCRAFEDTDLGLEAARRAGMEAVDIRLMVRPPEG